MLRIVHTSDWHIGQNFIGKSREACHRAFFSWLKTTLQHDAVDVLIVAGDIFDTATPPSYSRELYHQFIADVQPLNLQLIVLGGNHDSVAVLSESASLLRVLNTRVIPALASDLTQHIVPLYDKSGQVGAMLVALPYIRSRDLSAYQGLLSQAGQSEQDKNRDLQHQLATVYHQLYSLAKQQARLINQPNLPIIGTGHLTTVGASRSDSVRDIYIGSLEAFRADGFPPFDYLALGHIHQAQQVAGNPYFRYSGAPLALGFDEAHNVKQLLRIDINDQSEVTLPVAIPIPTIQPMASLTVTLADVRQQVLHQLNQHIADWQQPSNTQTLWLELLLSGEDALLTDIQHQLQQQLADLPVDVLKIRRLRSTTQPMALQQLSLHELSPNDVFQARLTTQALGDDSVKRLTLLHDEVLHQVQTSQQNITSAEPQSITPQADA